jgi:hypothetical protein
MVQTNRITIIPSDNAVYLDLFVYSSLDLSTCQIPSNVHAFQWKDNQGWIEFNDGTVHEYVSIIPDWAINCVNVWEDRYNKNPPTSQELEDALAQLNAYSNIPTEPSELHTFTISNISHE